MFKKWMPMFFLALLLPFECPIYSTLPVPEAPTTPRTTDLSIYANQEWQATGLTVQVGDSVTLEVLAGLWRSQPGEDFYGGDGGDSLICNSSACVEPLPGFPKGGLIGRIGSTEPFAIGSATSFTATSAGALQLRMNDPGIGDNEGALIVKITVE